ncbi:gephyrin-like molybdotransferase Glp [candidate division KSB1 bacterium]
MLMTSPNKLISPAGAIKNLLGETEVLPGEKTSLETAAGRVLAAPILADRDLPPANRSSMDGYAVKAADLTSVPVELPVLDEIRAGFPASPLFKPGNCVRIFTGANLPPGADSVAMVETTKALARKRVRFLKPVIPYENVMRRGEEARKGRRLLFPGRILGPVEIGICAMVGMDPVRVFRKPRVGVLATGEELRRSGDKVTAYQIRDSNGPALKTALDNIGLADTIDLGRATDDLDTIKSQITEALASVDILLLTGGVSVGDYDFVPEAVAAAGGRILFHGLSMKPGKPTLAAITEDHQLILGLPGNPLSTLTAFFEIAVPPLRKMAGLSPPWVKTIAVKLETAVVMRGVGTRFALARLRPGASDGLYSATYVPRHSSADIIAAAAADGVLVFPPGRDTFASGEIVDFKPWRNLP